MLSASLTWIQQHGAAVWAIVIISAVLYAAWLAFLQAVRPKYPDRTRNGIAAGPIKVYDNRFLSIRLDELEANLEKLGAIDPEKLDTNIGTTQTKAASTSEAGVTIGADASKQDGKDKSETNPSSAADAGDAKLSQSARNRLAEQINLRYELVGLRMILERSLTDRLWPEGASRDARLQAVLGLQVSLDPPAHCKGCAAIVEVTLTSPSGEPVSLVALLPQERTNNTLFVNKQSGSASGAGELQGRRFGVLWKRTRASAGMVAEPETVAFVRPGEPKALTVGWQFRPLLESPAVTPGLRQVFAVVALPSIDAPRDENSDKPVTVEASVRTYWRRYDAKTGTTSPRWSWPGWRVASEERVEAPQIVDVAFSQATQEQLQPDVTQITTKQLGPETVVVMVNGKDFFPGTTVAIGSKVHRDAASGLLIKSDHHFQVTTTPEELVYGEGIINGRYGPTVKLMIPEEMRARGINIPRWEVVRSSGVKFQWLKVFLSSSDPNPLTAASLSNLPDPIVMVGDHVVPPPYALSDTTLPGPLPCVLLRALVPAEWDPETTPMRLTFPFCGRAYQQVFGITNTAPHFSLSVVRWTHGQSQSFLIATTDEQFRDPNNWSVELGGEIHPLAQTKPNVAQALVRLSGTQIRLTVPAEDAHKCEVLAVHFKADNGRWVFPLPIPPLLAAFEKPTLSNEAIEASSKSNNFVKIKGTQLDWVDKVSFTAPESSEPVDAKFSCSPDNSVLTVFIPSGSKPGFGKLVAQDKDQALIGEAKIIFKD